jgi:hypothetical protein
MVFWARPVYDPSLAAKKNETPLAPIALQQFNPPRPCIIKEPTESFLYPAADPLQRGRHFVKGTSTSVIAEVIGSDWVKGKDTDGEVFYFPKGACKAD